MFCTNHVRRSSRFSVRMIVGSASFLETESIIYAALVFGNRYPCCLSFFDRVSFVSVQKHSWICSWICMDRSALKFAVRMQKHSSWNSSSAESVLMFLNSWILFCIFFCMLLCLSFWIFVNSSFIFAPLQSINIEKCGGRCKANGGNRLVRRGGKDGMQKFSPVCFYISTYVNVSYLAPS